MTTLRISLLGPLTVTIGDHLVAFRTDAERALLAYLAAHQGISQRRDTLAALLSPDRSDQEALTYLRNRLTRLRAALDDDNATPPWLTVDRKQIALRSGDDILVDVPQFERYLAAVETHPHRELAGCPICLAHLDAAVELVRGELLAGLNFSSDMWEAWLLTQREHLQQRALDAMTLLRDARLARGEWTVVLDIAQRQLRLEPWLEAAHRALMQAHVQLGDRNAALAQYEQCEAMLWDELGVEPEDETTTLLERIKAEGGIPPAASRQQPSTFPDNLPRPTGHFFGRGTEQMQLLQRLVDPAYRFITLVGTGGIGKTRLALEVGQQVRASFPDGVWFVALDAIKGGAEQGPEQIKIAIGEAARLGQGNKQLTGEQVLAILRDKRLLLILDNCETVLDELGFIPTWLNRAPQMVILATSREPLSFQSESVVLLAGLPITPSQPPPGWGRSSDLISKIMVPSPSRGGLGWGPAEALFAERGQMARADFAVTAENLPQVRQICERVDGSPLGIALAAAWVRRRSLGQIAEEIGRSLDFLSTRLRDVDPRHRSVRAVFETSWQLLAAEEQAVLAALAVFPTSFTAEAAAAVAGATLDDLDLLCEKSLLQQQIEPARYIMHSLLRQFAADKLAAGTWDIERKDVERAFVETFYQYARTHRDNYAALQPEWSNFSAGITKAHALAAWQTVLDFVQVLDEPWFRQIRFQEMRAGLGLALEAARALADEVALARTLLRLGEVEVELNEYEVAEAHLAEAIQKLMRLEDGLGIAQAKYLLGRIKSDQAQDYEALQLFVDSKRIFDEEDDQLGVARNLNMIAFCYMKQYPDFKDARDSLEESIALQRNLAGSSTYVEALRYLSRIKIKFEEYTAAENHLVEAAKVSRERNDLGDFTSVLFERMVLCKRRSQWVLALRFGHECLAHSRMLGSLRWEALIKTQLGIILHQGMKEYKEALSLFDEGLQIFVELDDLFEQAHSHYCLYKLYADMDASEQSHNAKQQALLINAKLNNPWLGDLLKQ